MRLVSFADPAAADVHEGVESEAAHELIPDGDLRSRAREALRELEAAAVEAPAQLPGARSAAGPADAGDPLVTWEFSTLLALRFRWTPAGATDIEIVSRAGA